MIRYILIQRQYWIESFEKRCVFVQITITFNKTKSDIHLFDEYFLITTPILLANLLTNLSFIGHI